jgi:peptidoglycan hydrolase-like protein with peptidoglycan-binding domain
MVNKKRNIQALLFVELRLRIIFLILCSLAFIPLAGEVTQARSLSKRSVAQEVSKEEILAAEGRLSDLGYWTGPVDGTLDSGSRHALIAFQKVEGRQRTGKLTRAELQALLSAQRPLSKYSGYAHVEIDLSRQVLFIVDATGTAAHILPVCTGNEKSYVDHGEIHRAHTPRGRFRVSRKIAGWRRSSLGLLYYPNYIHNGIAIHGSLAMAVYPASHGCIRIPMFASKELSELTPVGTEVIVYDD